MWRWQPSPFTRSYPGVLRDIARSRFVAEEPNLARIEHPEQVNVPIETPYYDKSISLDVVSSHFDGLRAGDIIEAVVHGVRRCKFLVEGYAYDHCNSDTVIAIRVLSDGKIEDSPRVWRICDLNEREHTLVAKRGEYDLTKDYGVAPADKPLFLSLKKPGVFARRSIKRMRKNGRSSLDKSVSIERAFQRFNAMLLRGEMIDFLRRFNRGFPLKNMDGIEREIMSISKPRQIQRWGHRFFRNLRMNLNEEYTDDEYAAIRRFVAHNRRGDGVAPVQQDAFEWMKAAILNKIGMGYIEPFEITGGTNAERCAQKLNHLVEQVAVYLTPLYRDGKAWAPHARTIFDRKPVYLRELLGAYPDAVSAARHVVAVGMNAATSMVERAYSYDFKHVFDQTRIFPEDIFAGHMQEMGPPIFYKIVDRIENPTGKQLPLVSALMYFDGDIYTVYPFAPPSSSGKNVLRLEISTGCDWGRCTYCSLYEDEAFSLATMKSFKRHAALVKEYLGEKRLYYQFNRLFLSGGNGLSMPTKQLVKILGYVNKHMRYSSIYWTDYPMDLRDIFPYRTRDSFRRIESYATTRAILKHGEEGLKRLRKKGLNLVYWGVESGNDDTLKMIRTGYSQNQIISAGAMLHDADINISATVMPGVSGIKYLEGHELDTARTLAQVYPRYLTFMGVCASGTAWERGIHEALDNRFLTIEEMIEHQKQMRDLYLDEAKKNPRNRAKYTRVAAHRPDETPASKNLISFSEQI